MVVRNMNLMEQILEAFFEGKIIEAERKLNRLLETRKDDPQAWFLKSFIEKNKGNNEEALKAIEHAISMSKNYTEAWVLKGIILRNLARYKESLDAFDKAMELQLLYENYEDYEILIEKAKTYLEMGDRKKALEIINKVMEINPEDDEINKLLKSI